MKNKKSSEGKKTAASSGIKWRPGNSTPQRPQFFPRARARARAPVFFHFPSFRKNDAVLCERRVDRRYPPSPYSLPPARIYQRVPENLNQRIAFSSSIVTRRMGDAEAQRDRYAGSWISNGTWPVLYSAFMFSHLSGACESARKSFVFPPFRRRARRIVIGSDQTWLEAETKRRRKMGEDCTRCKRPITQSLGRF